MNDKNTWVDGNKIYAIKRGENFPLELVLYANSDYRGFEGICYLTTGERPHMIDGQLGEKTDTGFIFHPEKIKGDIAWEFIEVTYENFKSEFCNSVIDGKRILEEVTNTDELIDWYHKQFPKR